MFFNLLIEKLHVIKTEDVYENIDSYIDTPLYCL